MKNQAQPPPPPQQASTVYPMVQPMGEMTLKNYIRKWSNWVIDIDWIFVLKFLVDILPSDKLYMFIKHYPILDNFLLNWMWWSYTLNRDLEAFTHDPFRGIGSMPWLVNDINNNSANKTDKNGGPKDAQNDGASSDEKSKSPPQQPKPPQQQPPRPSSEPPPASPQPDSAGNQTESSSEVSDAPTVPDEEIKSQFYQLNEIMIRKIESFMLKFENNFPQNRCLFR